MKLYIPVRDFEMLPEVESCYREFERLTKELPQYNDNADLILMLSTEESGNSPLKGVKFTFIEGKENDLISGLAAKHSSFYTMHIYMFLSIEFQFTDGFEESELVMVYAQQYINRLVLLLNLVYATPLVFLPGIGYSGDKFLNKTHYIGGEFDPIYVHAQELKWPELPGLDFAKVLKWMLAKDIKLHSVSDSPLSRAINAYSHQFTYHLLENDSSQLFWCVLGIEALYAKGNTAISEQIRQKIKIVLGEPAEFKKKLSKLYEYRSRLIHGDFDFPAKFSSDYERFSDDYQEYLAFGNSLLLSSLRKLIQLDLSGFDINYHWAYTPNANCD